MIRDAVLALLLMLGCAIEPDEPKSSRDAASIPVAALVRIE